MTSVDDIHERGRAWRDAGIIDQSQLDRIVAYEREADAAAGAVDRSHVARQRMQALFGVLGVLLVGLGVLLTVITNWDTIGDLTRLGMLVSTLVIVNAGGLVADARSAPRWVGSVAYAVGMLVFTGGIFVVADMYNVQAHDPLGLLLVAVFGTGIALLADRMTVGWIAAVGWLGWGMHELARSLEDLAEQDMMAPLLASVVLGCITAISLGWALSGIARADVIAVPLRSLATGGLTFALVQASFAWHETDEIGSATKRPEPWIMLALALVACWLLSRHASLERRRQLAGALVGVALFVTLVAAWPDDVLIAVTASVLLGLGGIGMFLLGLVESRSELFGWGIAWLVLLVITRYVDFMASVDLGGPGFIGAGVLLIVVAVLIGRSRSLWRRREEVLQ